MKQTKTTLKELTAMYRAVLRHGILCNAIALGLIAATPAMANNDPNTTGNAWVFGDIVLADAPVGMATIGGRRINNWDGTKYQNDIPQYHMVGQSLSVTNSDMYVGPVSLELREIDAANDTFAYNYQWDTDGDEINNDVDLANWAGVGWNEEYATIDEVPGVYAKVAAKINGDPNAEGYYDNAGDTAPGVYMFSRLDTEHTNAGAMSFSGSTVTTNGTTVNADSISVTDGSTITVVNEDTLSLTAFNGGNIDTTGVTTLNAGTINIDGSRMIVDAGASLTINPTTSATFANNSATDGGAVYNAGTLTVSDATFNNNSATGNSGAIAGAAGSTLTLNNVAFSNNSADWGGAMVARGTTNITGGSFTENSSNDGGGAIYLATLINKGHKLNINGTEFTGNSTAGVDLDGGGAIGSFSDLTLKNATFTGNHVDGTASNGGGALFLGSVSTNDIDNTTFTSNTSATNGGAISMRFVDQGNNAAATLDIANSTFTSNRATDGKGGAIYNTFHNDKAGDGYASVSGSTFAGNSAYKGGAIYNEGAGTTDTVGGVMTLTDSTFTGNSATERGGALFNYGELTIDGVVFTNNTTTGESYPSQGGAIYNAGDVDYLDSYGKLTVNSTTFGDANDNTKGNIAMQGGAISNDSGNGYNAELTLNNTNFYYNKAQSVADGGYSALGGAIHNVSNADVTVTGDTIFKGNSAVGYAAEGGAIYNSSWEKFTFNNAVTFDANTVEDTDGANGGHGGAVSNADGTMIFKDYATFTGNKAVGDGQPMGGALHNESTVDIQNGALFSDNGAMYGGALSNFAPFGSAKLTITDGTFTENEAGDEGGAIFQYGSSAVTNINADSSNVVFSGNTANGVANDITNYRGTINLNAAAGKSITMDGGINGINGVLNINSVAGNTGLVDMAANIENHTVNVAAGELHLSKGAADGSNLTGSTVNVASGATINTIDDLINDYSSNINLDNGALIKGDIDFLAGTADKYAATNGATVKYKVGNLISDIGKGTKDIQVVSDGAKVDISEATWTSTNGAAFVSSDAFDGMMKVRGFEGGITEAADATAGAAGDGSDGVKETKYQLTENETVGTASSFYNNVKLTGDGVEDGDKSVTLDADLTAEENANVEISELKLAGTGKYVNNALTRIKNSRIDVNVDNYGTWESDPTTYSGTVNNYADSIASFDEDTFESTATLANAGNAILMRGVTFDSGAAITGSGTTTLAAGLTHFNDTANGNTVAVARGALFDGTIVNSGTVDTRNGGIDAGLGTVTGGDVYVDADYVANKIDMFATGRAVNKINLINSEYGDAASKVLDLGGNTLASGATFSGGYYTKMTDNGTSVTFSDKLMNTSGMHAQLGNWSAANFIGDSTEYVAATDSYSTTQGQTVGQALTALDTAIGNMSGFGSQNYAKNTTNVAANLTALDTQLKTVSTAGTIASGQTGFVTGDAANTALNAKQNTLTAGSNITISGDTISATDTTYTAGTGLALTGTTFSIADGGVGTTQLASGVQTSLGHADDAYAAAVTNKTTTVASDNTNLITSAGVYANAKNASYNTTATDNIAANSTIGGAINALDTAIGDVNYKDEAAVATSVLKNGAGSTNTVRGALDALDTAIANNTSHIGSMDFSGTNYLTSATDLTSAAVTLDSNIKTINNTIGTTDISGVGSTLTAAIAKNASDISTIGTGVTALQNEVGAAQTTAATTGLLSGQKIGDDVNLVSAIDTIATTAAGTALNNTFTGNNTFNNQIVAQNGVKFGTSTSTYTIDGTGVANLNSVTAANGFTVDANNKLNSSGLTASAATIAGNAGVGGNLSVTGTTTLTGLLTANGGISTTTLTTTGDATVGGALAVTGDTALTGDLAVTGDTTLTTLNATGAVDFDSTLNVDGATTLGSTLAVTGNTTVGGTLGVNGATLTGSTTALTSDKKVVSANGFEVSGTTSLLDNNFTLNSKSVTDIDAGAGIARSTAGSATTLATTSSVVGTIANQAQDATYTNTITTGSNVTGTTLNTAIANLDSAIGNMASLSARDDANSVGNALANGGTTTPTTVVAALNNIDATLGTVHNLSGKLTTAGTYKGNLASGTTTTVEDHLVAVDTAIGDRSSLASLNTAINAAAATDVATALETTGNLIGDMNFAGTNYLATVTDMSEAVRVLDSNITKIDHKVEKLERKVNSGMASMAALTALVPNARDCGDTQVSVGTGVYADRAGIAMGAFHYFNDHVLFNAGASYGGTRDWAFRAGITFGL